MLITKLIILKQMLWLVKDHQFTISTKERVKFLIPVSTEKKLNYM